MESLLSRLNSNQRQAALHFEGPLLVLAGAGSGKTNTMAHRIAYLIAHHQVGATRILGLSFTNKAAGELKERVVSLVTKHSGKYAARGLTVTTFHSLCVKILRRWAPRLGFQGDFSIVDDHDQRDLLKQVLKQIRIDDRKFDIDALRFEIGQAKNRFLSGPEAEEFFLESKRLGLDYALAAASAFPRYQAQLKALNSMDFDDLIYHAVRLLESDEEVRKFYSEKFQQILVDEYQDTNASQFRLLRQLTSTHQNICVVGDDDQSIYAWRGADPSHILGFRDQFKNAKSVVLTQNYRSTSSILDAANHVIAVNRNRHPKSLWSERGAGEPVTEMVLLEDRDESEWVGDEIVRRQGEFKRPWKDYAILYRSNAQARLFEEALRARKIPYRIVGGMSFLDRKEIKDVLSYWRLVANPKDDQSLRRVINWPVRGVGKTALEALGNHAFEKNQSVYESLTEIAAIAPRAQKGVASFLETLDRLRERVRMAPCSPLGLAEWGRATLEIIGAKQALSEETEDPLQFSRKWEMIEELVNSAGQMRVPIEDIHDEPDSTLDIESQGAYPLLREFIARVTLEAQDQQEESEADSKKERDQVTLLTLHGAKGLEYPVVFLVGMEEGFLPHHRTLTEGTDLSEERRLAYVGITRARDHLILTRVKQRIRYGKPVPRMPSRFLQEIPVSLMIRRDESGVLDPSNPEAKKAHEEKVVGFLSQIRAQLQKS